MIRSFVMTLVFCLCWYTGIAQHVQQLPEEKAAYAHDTSLINHYIKITLPFALRSNTLDSAYFYLKRIYSLSKSRQYNKGLAQYYRILGVTYFTRNKRDSAMLMFEKELLCALQCTDPQELARAYDTKGWLYQNEEQVDSSEYYYLLAVRIADSIGNRKFSAEVYHNLSSLFFIINDAAKAHKYAFKSYQIAKDIADTALIVNGLFNMGNAKYVAKDYDSAMILFDQVIGLVHNPTSYNYVLVRALSNEAAILTNDGKNEEAISRYKEILKMKSRIAPSILPYIYNGIASAQYNIHDLSSAQTNGLRAIRFAKKYGIRNSLRQNFQLMSEIKEAKQQFGQALKYRKKYDSLNAIMMGEETTKNVHLMEVKYQTEKKNKQIAQQKLTLNQKQQSIERRTTWIWIIIGGLIALAVIFVLSRRNYRHRRKLDQQSLLTLQKQHEVETLETKMEAREEERNRIGKEMHDDIGSSLTTILYLANDLKTDRQQENKQSIERIGNMAESVVGKMNEIIWSMNRQYDTLDDLIAYTRQHGAEFLDNYEIDYHFDTPDPVPDIHLQGEQRRNIYLVIKEALHNIVKHAAATKVCIAFKIDKLLEVEISDNGKGIDTGKLKRFGNGLRNMQQRMESIGGRFEIANNNGTIITLQTGLEYTENNSGYN